MSSLSAKTSQLKHITLDIYDNARSQGTLDNTNEVFSNMSTSVRGSMGRMTRMASQGDKLSVVKLAGMLIVVFLVLYFVLGWLWHLFFS